MNDLPRHLGGHGDKTHVDDGALRWAQDVLPMSRGRSMIDLGCGPMGQVQLARSMGWSAHGVDGDPTCEPDIVHDFTQGDCDGVEDVSLCWTCEFLEHVEERFLAHVWPVMRSAESLIMCAAPPGKAGHHHVNLQTTTYWIAQVEDNTHLYYDGRLPSGLRARSTMVREFMRDNGLVFVDGGTA